jgi:hypothetical protein
MEQQPAQTSVAIDRRHHHQRDHISSCTSPQTGSFSVSRSYDDESTRDTFAAAPASRRGARLSLRRSCCGKCCNNLIECNGPCKLARRFPRMAQYRTVKTVAVHNLYLAWLHHVLLVTIFIYVVVVNIGIGRRYMLIEAPVGHARTTLKQPSWNLDTPVRWKSAAQLSYCEKGQPMPGQISNNGKLGLPCTYKDEYFLSEQVGDGVLFTTRQYEYAQSLPATCANGSSPQCVEWSKDTVAEYYVVQVENFTLQLDHAAIARESGLSVHSTDTNVVDAWIEDVNGQKMNICDDYKGVTATCPMDVARIGPPRTGPCKTKTGCSDLIPLQTILRAAGITDLDRQGDVINTKRGQSGLQSHRFAGLVLQMTIFYDNTFSFDQSKFRYRYTVLHVDKTQFKVEQTIFANSTNRVLWNRHGIFLTISVAGTVGRFDLPTLLLQLVSGLALLSIASIVTGLVAGYIEDTYDTRIEHLGKRQLAEQFIHQNEQTLADIFEQWNQADTPLQEQLIVGTSSDTIRNSDRSLSASTEQDIWTQESANPAAQKIS